MRILDLDVECRPMAWYAGDMVTKEITSIAWRFVDEPEKATRVWLLEPSRTWAAHKEKRRRGLERFLEDYRAAELVTGHYLRGFDLPLLNAACFRLGLPPLPQKLSEDTKSDLTKMGGLSKSQENLAAYLDAKHEKPSMNTHTWEVANSLVEEGRAETKRRVVGDVDMHVEFRTSLVNTGHLCRPRVWYPTANGASARYVG